MEQHVRLNKCFCVVFRFELVPVRPAELQSEDRSARLPEALPPCRQREAQHGGALLQYEEGDRRKPRDGGPNAAEDDRVSGLG